MRMLPQQTPENNPEEEAEVQLLLTNNGLMLGQRRRPRGLPGEVWKQLSSSRIRVIN